MRELSLSTSIKCHSAARVKQAATTIFSSVISDVIDDNLAAHVELYRLANEADDCRDITFLAMLRDQQSANFQSNILS